MSRKRAACIVLKDNCILLMYRNNNGSEYYAYIGGGVEDGESPEDAVVRETYEESSIHITVSKLLYSVKRRNGEVHYFYLCDYVEGYPEVQKGTNEFADNQTGQNIHIPKWVRITELPSLTIYPDVIADRILKDIDEGLKIENISIETE